MIAETASQQDQLMLGIARASSELIVNPDLDTAMDTAASLLGQAMGVDGCHIYQNQEDGKTGEVAAVVRHSWLRANAPITGEASRKLEHAHFPSFFANLSKNGLYAGRLSSEEGRVLELMEAEGIQSFLTVPIFVEQEFWGLMGFDHCREERQWTDAEQAVLQSMGTAVGAAVMRDRYRHSLERAINSSTEKLIQSENYLSLIYNNTYESMALMEVDHGDQTGQRAFHILSVNERFEKGLAAVGVQFPPENLAGMTIEHFWSKVLKKPANEVTVDMDHHNEAVDTLRMVSYEWKLPYPDGDLTIENTLTPIRDEEGLCKCLLLVIRNITRRKEAEKALKISEWRYRSVVEDQTEFIVRWKADGCITFCNDSYCKYFGLDKEAILDTNFMDLIPDIQQERVQKKFEALHPDQPVATDEHMVVLANGEKRWNQWIDRGIFDEKGELLEYQSVGRDIHERKLAEQALKNSEHRLQLAIQNIPVMLDALDEKGNILVWNNECEQVTGYRAEEIIGNPNALSLLYPDPKYRKQLLDSWSGKGQDLSEIESVITCKDGSQKTISWTHRSRSNPIPGWADWGVGIDITERKRARKAEKKLLKDVQVRIKELECMYRIARLCADPSLTIPEVLRGTAEQLPQSLQYPDIAWARIRLEDRNYATDNFCEVNHYLSAPMIVRGKNIGTVEAGYTKVKPYLLEESHLVEAIAHQLETFIAERMTEENYQEINRKFTTLLDNLPGVVYRCQNNTNWSMEFLSQECEELTGYSPQEIYSEKNGLSWNGLIYQEDQEKVWEAVQHALIQRKPFRITYRIQHRDGSERWVWEQGIGVWEDGEKLVALEGFIHDITDIKQSEERVISAILETEDRERKRMAKELHDGLQQRLTAASLNLAVVNRERDRLEPRTLRKFEMGIAFLQQALRESREIAHNLMPRAIEDFGLVVTLESMVDGLKDVSDTRFEFINDTRSLPREPQTELSLYRIVQEAVSNALKHAQAKVVQVRIAQKGANLLVVVQDDGIGFDPRANLPGNDHLGLNNMRSRARSVQAELRVESAPGKGTTVQVSLPIYAAVHHKKTDLV